MSREDETDLFDGMCDEVDFCLTEFSCLRRSFIKSSEDMEENAEKSTNRQSELSKLSLDEVIQRLRKINLTLTQSTDSGNKAAASNQKVKEYYTQTDDCK